MDAYKDIVTVRTGSTLRLNVPFWGCPTPTAEWHRHANKMSDDDRVRIDRHEARSQLIVRDVVRTDAGIYSLTVTNEAGRESANIHVNVIGKLTNSFFLPSFCAYLRILFCTSVT